MGRLYTRKGDGGETVLFDGTPVRKDDDRVRAYGAVDELNAQVGMAAAMARRRSGEEGMQSLHERLVVIQHELFAVGAELATPSDSPKRGRVPAVTGKQAGRLEAWIDEASAAAGPLREFVLPGGDELACQLHVCRTVCRRAERRVVKSGAREPVNPQVLAYVNRLSDLFFAWARMVNHAAGVGDQVWAKGGGTRR